MNEFNYEGSVGGHGAALRFRGSLTGAEIDALTVNDVLNGDMYNCTQDYTGSITFHKNYGYAATINDNVLSWSEIESLVDLTHYVKDDRKVNTYALSSDVTLKGTDIALTGYSAKSGGNITASDTTNSAVSKLEERVITLEAHNNFGY